MMRLTDSEFKPTGVNRWFIWGMPLSGKTSFGKKLKKIVTFPVFDLDKEIESFVGKSITEIFEEDGEVAFRDIEAKLLRKLIVDNDEFLMVVGGGTPCYSDNDDFMLKNGNCLFMHTGIDEILKRSKITPAQRPLLAENPEERLKKLYVERLQIYQKAHAEFFSEKEGLDYFATI